MKFKIGDKVSFLNQTGCGVIAEILNSKMVSVFIEDGFEIPVLQDQLILIPANQQAKKNIIAHPPIASVKTTRPILRNKNISKQHTKNSGALAIEVDLHIEELMDNYKNMSNSEIIQVQLNHVKRKLDKAILTNMHKIIFIHGVGTGRLKTEIHAILNSYDGIRFYDASYKKYGYGATEVVISSK